MAQKVIVELVDDIDGTPIPEGQGRNVTFALEGRTYEIDLSPENHQKLTSVLEPFIAAARTVSGGSRSASAKHRTAAGRRDLAAIRAWAHDNDYKVSDRGRIPAKVIDAYDAAH